MSKFTVFGFMMAVLVSTALPCAGLEPSGIQQRIEGFVAAFNSGDADTMLRFYEKALTPEFRARRSDEERRSMYLRLSQDLGRLEVQRIKVEGSGSVAVAAESERAGSIQLSFELEENPPHRIAGIGIRIGGPGPEMDLPPVPQLAQLGLEAWRTAVDRYLRELAKETVFSGTVLVARGDEVLFQGAYGLANREHRVSNTLDTRFDIGSITKIMTKTAIGQLAREGKLSLSDTIAEHIPDYPNRSVATKVTIDHLLRHTSGLGDIFVDDFFSGSKTRFRSPDDFIDMFAETPLLFEPGEGRQYSNAGYVVLGAIVAAAGGQPYNEYLEENVLAPAGMTSTMFPSKDLPTPNVATGYTKDESGAWRNNVFLTPIQGCPAGGLAASAGDLFRFDRALRSGLLLGPGWTQWVFTDQLPDRESLQGDAPFANQAWGIAGGAQGVNALLESDGHTAAVVLANMDPPIAMALGKVLRGSIRE